ncbi:unnamed protein product [Calypogeia fissa]
MVKFAKYFASHLVPEWRPAYCNYKELKKELKLIKAVRIVEYRVLGKEMYIALRGPSLRNIRSRTPRAEVILVHKKTSPLYGSQLDLVETELLVNSGQAEGEKPFFERLDSELNKVNEFYNTKEKEFLQHADILDEQMQSLFELKLVVDNRKAFPARPRSKGDEEIVTSLNPDSSNGKSIDVIDSIVSLHNEMLFQTIMNQNTMGKSSLPNADQISSIREQLGDMNNMSASEAIHLIQRRTGSSWDWKEVSQPPIKSVNALARSLSDDVSRAPEFKTSSNQEFSAFKKKVQHSEKMLREAFTEFYRGLGLLRSYSSLNMIAFTKILKKYEKVTQRGAASTYLRTVDNSYFQTSDKVTKLMIWVEAMFTDYVAAGDRQEARKALKPPQAKRPLRVTFFLGMFTGCSIMLAVAFATVVHVLIANFTEAERAARTTSYMNSVFPVFSTIALLLLHLYMYGWNLYLWQRTRINYAFIFEFPAGTELSYREVLLVCTGLTVVLGGGMLGHMGSYYSESIFIDLIPLGVVLIVFGLLFCPFRIYYFSARKFFLNCMWRIIWAPFYKVLLADFFLGDQLCSQVPLLRNLEYIMCYYGGGHFKTDDGEACTKNGLFVQVTYMISVLPYWWRLMQCLKRYRDESGGSHLANGGKYLSAIVVVFTRIHYGNTDSVKWMMLYIISATFATFYQLYWDLVIDWGLLRRNSVNPWLRDKLILEDQRYVYFLSMMLNVILRFPWLLSATHFQFGGLDSHVTDFFLAALEVFRRGQWNFYRLENEHLNNVGHYRATKTVPLPFVR